MEGLVVTYGWLQDRASVKCEIARSGNFAYVPIPKNASTLTLAELGPGFNWVTEPEQDGVYYFGVVRDPLERWVEGMAQFFATTEGGYDQVHSDLGRLVYEGIHSHHTAPQHMWADRYPSAIWYKSSALEQMWSDLEGRGVPRQSSTLDDQNLITSVQEVSDMYNFLTSELVANPNWNGLLADTYAKDITLYEAAIGV